MSQAWYASWFDSPFYHILYKQHDEKEAHHFIDNLIEYLSPLPDSTFLDVACGKGRHSFYLAEKGFHVTGIDLSPTSIKEAALNNHDHLRFEVHDMRDTFKQNSFNYVVNMFTSFGYFEQETDNLKAIQAMHENLTPQGICVLDFFNATKVCKDLVPFHSTVKDDIQFNIHKKVEGKEIIKEISFDFEGIAYSFEEKVWLYEKADFESLFLSAGFNILKYFGDYHLNDFNPESSPRFIIIAGKS